MLAENSVDKRMLEILRGKNRPFDDYARQSTLKAASPAATDISAVEAARQIVPMEESASNSIQAPNAHRRPRVLLAPF